MKTPGWQHLSIAIALAAVLASCGHKSTTGPKPVGTFDGATVESSFQKFDRLLAQPAFQSFQAAGNALGGAEASAGWLETRELRALGTTSAADVGSTLATMSERLTRWVPRPGPEPAIPVIAPELRGKTLVYSPAEKRYVVSPDRAGAPPNGLRYILYATNPVTREPIVTEEIGFADLTDEGEAIPNGFALRLRATAGALTFLDYAVTVRGAEDGGRIEVRGFMADGTERADFGVTVRGHDTPEGREVELAFGLDLGRGGLSLAASLRFQADAASQTSHVDQQVRIGPDVIHVVATQTDDAIDAMIRVNGDLFATASGPSDNPSLAGPDGQPLSPSQMVALHYLLGAAGSVVRLAVALLQPIHALLALSHPA